LSSGDQDSRRIENGELAGCSVFEGNGGSRLAPISADDDSKRNVLEPLSPINASFVMLSRNIALRINIRGYEREA
jgi:hypothetical protein